MVTLGQSTLGEMLSHFEELRIRTWRVPLFIVGAGVSASQIPAMDDIIDHFAGMKSLPGELRDEACRLSSNKKARSRITASHFFGALQRVDPVGPGMRNAWKQFTSDFLLGKIRRGEEDGNRTLLWDLDPTPFHEIMAEQVVRRHLPAVCVSLNYDGLTSKAIRRRALESMDERQRRSLPTDPVFPCRVLTSGSEILEFYSRYGCGVEFFPMIKLKGDIFSAVCDTEGCRAFGARDPVYEIGAEFNVATTGEHEHASSQKSAGNDRKTIQGSLLKAVHGGSDTSGDARLVEALRCKSCSTERRIELDFPGYRLKEVETTETLDALYRLILASVSAVAVCGVSGTWDQEIVQLLRCCAEERGLKVFCVARSDPPMILQRVAENIPASVLQSRFLRVVHDFRKGGS